MAGNTLWFLLCVGVAHASTLYFPDSRLPPALLKEGEDDGSPDLPPLFNDSSIPIPKIQMPLRFDYNNEVNLVKGTTVRNSHGVVMIPGGKHGFLAGESRQSSNNCDMNYAFTEAGQSIVIQSPNYPNEYPNNVRSSICMSSPSGTTMNVVCDVFNLENQASCYWDYLGIGFNGQPNENTVTKYCGRGPVNTQATTSNSLAIIFKTDSSNPGSTTNDPYRFSCKVQVSGSSGGGGSPPPPGNGDCSCGQRNQGSRIVGGTEARPNEFPWRCYMQTDRYRVFCGCSIISNRWVLTAAHCTRAIGNAQIYVMIGDHNTAQSTGQRITVESVIDHPNYNSRTYDNDVSLLKLAQSIQYSQKISPVCLPFKYANDEFQGTTIVASGWGTTREGGSASSTLQKVDIPVLTTQECSRYFSSGQITENMICTYEPGKDTCQGDSGGSIDLGRDGRYYAIGVVSWGYGCARENGPGVYAKTTKFLSWIRNTSGETFCEA